MKDKIIFSTDPDFTPEDQNDVDEESITPENQNLRIWLEKRPGNKVVSIVKNFMGTTEELKMLEKTLKKRCGVGGSIKDNEIIIQTKDRQKLLQILKEMGYFAKLSGG